MYDSAPKAGSLWQPEEWGGEAGERGVQDGGDTCMPMADSCWCMANTISQFSSATQSCLALSDPMDCSMPGLPVHHQLLEFTQTHVHWVGDAIQPSHPLSSPSPLTFSLSQHQGLFQWVSSSYQVAEVLEFQLQHQSFQWIFRTDFLYDWLVWSPCSPRYPPIKINSLKRYMPI